MFMLSENNAKILMSLNQFKNTTDQSEEKFRNRYLYRHIPKNTYNKCNTDHNPPDISPKKKHYKSAFQIFIERNRIKPIKNEKKAEKKELGLILSKKKVNEILNIAKTFENKKDKNNASTSRRKHQSINPFLTSFGNKNGSFDSYEQSLLVNIPNEKNQKATETKENENNSFQVIKSKMRSKFGKDFYNKIKVHLIMSNQKSETDLESFKKFVGKNQETTNQKTFKTEEDDHFFLRQNSIKEFDFDKISHKFQDNKNIDLQEYRKQFQINYNDEYFPDYKQKRLDKARSLLRNSETNNSIINSDLTRFPYFLKKIENHSNNSSFMDNYCPLETTSENKTQKKMLKSTKLPQIVNNNKQKKILLPNNLNNLDEVFNSNKSTENGPLSERLEKETFQRTIMEIQTETKTLRKKTKILKRKAKKETRSLNLKLGSLLKSIENIKL